MSDSGGEIPLIDVAPLTAGDGAARRRMLASLQAALEIHGFMYLRDHGVAQSLVDAVFAQARQFFPCQRE